MSPTEETVPATPDSWDREGAARASDRQGPGLLRLPGVIVWLVLVWLAWFDLGREMLATTLGDAATPRAVGIAAIGAVLTRIAAELLEAGFYVALWRGLGRTLPFAAFFVAIVSLSTLDLIATQLARWAADSPSPWVAVLCGFHTLPGVLAGEPGLRVGFGAIGLLALARVAGTIRAQRAAGARWRTIGILTGAIWLGGRLATWWVTDLVRGMSPLP